MQKKPLINLAPLGDFDFKISQQDFVTKKMGKITQEYKLLNPPLGKGERILKK